MSSSCRRLTESLLDSDHNHWTWVRHPRKASTSHKTDILRQVPSGLQELPSNALASQFGGSIAVDPQEKNGTKTLERIFVFDLSLPQDLPPSAFGERVYVRFSHEFEPLGFQLWRRLRQLLLSRLAI